MTNERKFVEDKVYLQGPDGQIWEYEAMLANQNGFVAVTPNPSKKATAAQRAEQQALEEEQARIAAEEKAAAEQAEADKTK